MNHTPDQPLSHASLGRESAPRLAEFVADLLWPRLFQSVSLALRPERIGLAFFALVAAMAVGSIAEAWDAENATSFVLLRLGGAFSAIAAGVFGLSAGTISLGVAELLALPSRVWATYGWYSLLLHTPALLLLAVAGCAVCRMAACDFSQGVVVSWTDGLAFALRKAGSILTAFLAPLVVVGVIAAGIAVVGSILAWPGVNIVGAVLYGLFLLASAIAVFLLACWALGLPLLIPAIACEGADGLDAIQRAYAYVLGRPLRLLMFAAVALLIAWVAALVASLFAGATAAFTEWAVTGISGESGGAVVHSTATEGPAAFAARIVRFWLAVPAILVWSIALSLYFSASTVVYLLIRQVADGQDWGELWMPGMIEGTMAQALRARAAASGAPESEEATRIAPVAGRTVDNDEDD